MEGERAGWIVCFLLLFARINADKLDIFSPQYMGCYDVSDPSYTITTRSDNSVTTCVRQCKHDGSTFAGMQGGTKCICGNNLYSNTSEFKVHCYMKFLIKCPGDPTAVCGAKNDKNKAFTSVYRVCPVGWYGSRCNISCPSACGAAGCHMNGDCFPGDYACPAGTRGPNCSDECPGGTFGPGCKFPCSVFHCSDQCNSRIGFCESSCPVDRNGKGPFCRTGDKPGENNPDGPCPFCTGCKNGCGNGTSYSGCPSDWAKQPGTQCKECKDGLWAAYCTEKCSDHCTGGQCAKNNGTCSDGCVQGYYGAQCSSRCSSNCGNETCWRNGSCKSCKPGFYGVNCSLSCHENCKNGECWREGGKCKSCKKGFYGDDCSRNCSGNCNNDECLQQDGLCEGCKLGYHGHNCSHECSENCNTNACLQYNGTCKDGCKPGFYTHNCSKPCPGHCKSGECRIDNGTCVDGCKPGYHGHECSYQCPNNCKNDTCLQNDGTCEDGCKPGFYMYDCSKPCPGHCESGECRMDKGDCVGGCKVGWFWPNCSAECSPNCKSNACSQTEGHCVNGCKSGYHGLDCSSQCPNNCKNDTCLQNNGTCEGGCKPGFYTSNCSTPCPGHCKSWECEMDNGYCVGSCKVGWFWPDCSVECPPNCKSNTCLQIHGNCAEGCINGHYGDNCEKKCPGHCESNRCSQQDGSCPGKCDTTFHGNFCNQTCPAACKDGKCEQSGRCSACKSGYFGEKCTSECGKCSGESCSQSDGSCEACTTGYFGTRCNITCSEHCVGRTCAKDTGECKRGCSGKFYLRNCSAPCPSGCAGVCNRNTGSCKACNAGLYGTSCQERCPEACLYSTCDQSNGECTAGCQAQTYGPQCEHTCNQCLGEKCDRLDGCALGCQPGHCGKGCEKTCEGEDACEQVTCRPAPSSGHGGIIAGVVVFVLAGIVGGVTFGAFKCGFITCPKSSMKKENPPNELQAEVSVSMEDTYPGDEETRTPLMTPGPPGTTTARGKKPKPQLNVHPMAAPQANGVAETDVDDHDYYNVIIGNRIPKSALKRCISKDNTKTLEKEYTRLPKGPTFPWQAAEQNISKNRYKGIMAYDHSRVVLKKDNATDSDYINANYMPGFQQEKAFIASQGVTEQNMLDFWRMIWQENISKIVMTSKLVENMKVKCLQYWPEKVSAAAHYGAIQVTLQEETAHYQFVTRTLLAKKGQEERVIKQFHFLGWPDHGVPDSACTLVNFWHVVRSHPTTIPVLVHCSAGIGRTGTYLGLDYLLDEADAGDHVDVLACVNKLRKNRVDMVQTVSQYVLLYQAVYMGIFIGQTALTRTDFTPTMAEIHLEAQIQAIDGCTAFEENAPAPEQRGDENAEWDVQVFTFYAPGVNGLEVQNPQGSTLIFCKPPSADAVTQFWDAIQTYHCASVTVGINHTKTGTWLPTTKAPIALSRGKRVLLLPGAPGAQPQHLSIRSANQATSSSSTSSASPLDPTRRTLLSGDEPNGLYTNVMMLVQAGKTHPTADMEENTYMNVAEATKAHIYDDGTEEYGLALMRVDTTSPASMVRTWRQLQRGKFHVIVGASPSSGEGVFAVSCVLLDIMAKFGEVDIFTTVRQMRPHFIVGKEQYTLLHRVIEVYCQDLK